MVCQYSEGKRGEVERTWMKVLFRTNMTAVAYHAHVLPQKSICPISHTSLTSGWRRQNSLDAS